MKVFPDKVIKNRAERGQTSIEYALMVSVVAVLVMAMYPKIKAWAIGDGNCPNDSLLCIYQARFTNRLSLGEGNFRRFYLPR